MKSKLILTALFVLAFIETAIAVSGESLKFCGGYFSLGLFFKVNFEVPGSLAREPVRSD